MFQSNSEFFNFLFLFISVFFFFFFFFFLFFFLGRFSVLVVFPLVATSPP